MVSRTIFIMLLALILPPGHANAAIVNINFTGELHAIPGFAGAPFITGAPISGSYSYDTSITDTNSSATQGDYPGALTAFSLDLGNGATAELSSNAIMTVLNDSAGDKIRTVFNQVPSSGPDLVDLSDGVHTATYEVDQMGLELSSLDGNALSSDALIQISPLDFQTNNFYIRYNFKSGEPLIDFYGSEIQSFYLQGVALSVSVSTVPVPAAAWLFGSGLIGLIGIAGRKQA
jgi:hypothetical protein